MASITILTGGVLEEIIPFLDSLSLIDDSILDFIKLDLTSTNSDLNDFISSFNAAI